MRGKNRPQTARKKRYNWRRWVRQLTSILWPPLLTAGGVGLLFYLMTPGMPLYTPAYRIWRMVCRGILRIGVWGTDYSFYKFTERNLPFYIIAVLVIFTLSRACRKLFALQDDLQQIYMGMDTLLAPEATALALDSSLAPFAKKITDIRTTLDRRSWEAHAAEQRKNDLVVYLAHDIKTPLTSVIAYLNLLQEAPDLPTEQRTRYIGITLEKAYRLEQLIDEFFEITRFNLQSIVLYREPLHLCYMLRQMADEFYPILSATRNTVEVEAPPELTVQADPDKLARVFNNILKNAAAYSAPGTPIRIVAKQQEDEVFVSFYNQGKIIPQDQLDSIFEKFYRLDSARGTKNGGAGLGLAIAKEIVTAHGGNIHAASSAQGTCFTVMLPANSPESAV
ncbi:cell wall metabolism sensor histidine kinase WalK [Neobittarella massiliensis]|uniref:sensor histidine kinase n=1 Tax=Neobittarella massiliensis (ex Bilen et al. 2018) TaxID=2041842 RepID=UPI001FB1D446|nr:HAMP domain-containing sensor histidine kinase [Neobittarella massiliensis]